MPIWIRRVAGRVNLALLILFVIAVSIATYTQSQPIREQSNQLDPLGILIGAWLFSSWITFMGMSDGKIRKVWSVVALLCWIALFCLVKTPASAVSTPDTPLDRFAIQLVVLIRILYPLTYLFNILTPKKEWHE